MFRRWWVKKTVCAKSPLITRSAMQQGMSAAGGDDIAEKTAWRRMGWLRG